ncbi:MAG: glycosyltransferase family 2 protein [Bacteroidota bacterium]
MKEPIVSVIMPVYNAEKYLAETINSILAQTFVDFEFLIIDDGSTDKSLQILNSYADSRIKVLKNDKNIGYVQTLNKLIDLSKGKYIARQDNDDISFPERLKKQVDFLNKNEGTGVCGTNMFFFGDKQKQSLMPIRDEEIRAYMIINNPFCHPTIMYRKSLFNELKIDKYDESLCPAEDYAMWFEISKKTKLANLYEPLLKYRWHQNNTSQLKKDIQIEKANDIRKKIMKFTLSLEISEKENQLLGFISNPELVDYDDLLSFEEFCKKILEKNSEIGYYNQIVLRNLFFYFWTKVCFKSLKISTIKKWKMYFSSDLYSFKSVLDLISIKSIYKFIYDKK